MAARALEFDLGRGHARLLKLHDILNTTADRDFGVLRVAANVIDGERVTIGSDVFEIDIINTDSGLTVANGDLNNTTDPVLVGLTAHGLIVGDLIRVDNEIMRVDAVYSVDKVRVQRGRCGTTNATHANGATVYFSDTPGTIKAAGRIPVGLVATLTPTVFLGALVAEVNFDAGTSTNSADVRGIKIGSNTMLAVYDKVGSHGLATTETLTGSGNAWDATTMSGGSNPVTRRFISGTRVPTAGEVSAGELYIPYDFAGAAKTVLIRIVVTSTGAEKTSTGAEWDGAYTIVAPSGSNPGYVKLDNTGSVDWAATDTIHYFIAE